MSKLRDYLPGGGKRRLVGGGRRTGDRHALAVRPIDTGANGVIGNGQHHQAWQDQAWNAYQGNVGEYAAVVNWRAGAISRANLFVAKVDNSQDTTPEPADDQVLSALLERLGSGGDTGYSQLLKRMSIHLDVPGETILVGTETASGGQLWFPASTSQLEPYGGGWAVRLDETGVVDNAGRLTDLLIVPPSGQGGHSPTTVMKRIYDPDPRYPWLAISPGRYSHKLLRVVDRLTDRVNSNTVSRLLNKIVLLSNNVTLPGQPDRADLHSDPQMAGLIEAGLAAIEDPESAAARFPVLARVHGDPKDAVASVELGSEFDAQIAPLLELFIRRLALTLNVPPEILLGVGDSSTFANAYLVSEDAVRIHLAPTLELICDALTRAYLRPAIAQLNHYAGRPVYDPADYTVWYDIVRITQRANRAENALASKELGLISNDATRTAAGWDDSDKPSPSEVRADLLMRGLSLGRTPEEMDWYLAQLGLDTLPPTPPGNTPPSGVPVAGNPAAPAAVRGI